MALVVNSRSAVDVISGCMAFVVVGPDSIHLKGGTPTTFVMALGIKVLDG